VEDEPEWGDDGDASETGEGEAENAGGVSISDSSTDDGGGGCRMDDASGLGGWTCAACTLLNAPSVAQCAVCGCQR
jgi:hypothetical protein